MEDIFLKELYSLPDQAADPEAYAAFEKRIKQGKLSRDENPVSHFGSFFLPVDTQNERMFLVHHKKAGSWIPPGGHIDAGESPRNTVYREFQEELKVALVHEPITLFAVKPVDVSNAGEKCRVHNDFWFLVYIREQPFNFDRNEFYDARWFSFSEGLERVTHPIYIPIMHRIPNFIRTYEQV